MIRCILYCSGMWNSHKVSRRGVWHVRIKGSPKFNNFVSGIKLTDLNVGVDMVKADKFLHYQLIWYKFEKWAWNKLVIPDNGVWEFGEIWH